MPKIQNASGLTLNEIVNQLTLKDTADVTRELRSTGNDLYVKDGKAAHTSLISRKSHRDNAIELIHHSLAAEFGMTKAKALQILTSVFGHAPNRITVGDVLRLHDLGQKAQSLITDGVTVAEAFASAQQEDERPDRLGLQETGIPLYASQTPSEAESTTSEPVSRLASRGEKESIGDNIIQDLANCTPFETCALFEKFEWNHLAKNLTTPGRYSMVLLKSLPIDQKTSMLMALKELHDEALLYETPVSQEADLARSIIRLNKTYALSDVMPAEERITLHSFRTEFRKREDLCNNFVQWEAIDAESRAHTIQGLLDLHAEQFGYTEHKPLLEFGTVSDPDGLNAIGMSHHDSVELITNVPEFEDAREVINTVIHELTHWYQRELVLKLDRGEIDVASPTYQQARLMSVHQARLANQSYLSDTLGFPKIEAFEGYRHSPAEAHAYHSGDYVSNWIDEISSSPESSEEAS